MMIFQTNATKAQLLFLYKKKELKISLTNTVIGISIVFIIVSLIVSFFVSRPIEQRDYSGTTLGKYDTQKDSPHTVPNKSDTEETIVSAYSPDKSPPIHKLPPNSIPDMGEKIQKTQRN